MRKQHTVRDLFLKATLYITNRNLKMGLTKKMGPTSWPIRSYRSLFRTKPDPFGLNKSLEFLNTSERERAKRKGPKRDILNFQPISYSFKRLILILKRDLTLFVLQADGKLMRLCHIHCTLIFPKYATLSSTHGAQIVPSETTQKNKLIFSSKEQPFKDMNTMITFSLQGFQNWLIQPLVKGLDFKVLLPVASFTMLQSVYVALVVPSSEMAAAYHWYHSESIWNYCVLPSSVFLYLCEPRRQSPFQSLYYTL